MKNYINYRYRNFQNQSFTTEFRAGSENYADFMGAKLKSCDFRGSSLIGADFSETFIGRDKQKFKSKVMEMAWHIVIGIPLGFAAWLFNQVVIGCGVGPANNAYGWLTNPFVWIAAFSVAATVSNGWLFIAYMGMIGLMVTIASMNMVAANVVGVIFILAAFGASIFGLYLGYQKGSIAVGMVWIAVGVSSAISAGYSWMQYREIHYALLFAVITVLPAILATRAFSLHFNRVKMSAMTCFRGADLTNARFVNAVLDNCDFSDAKLNDVNWYGVTFKNCQFPHDWSRENQEAITQKSEDNLKIEKFSVNEISDLSNVRNT